MKSYEERLPMIDAAIEKLNGTFPESCGLSESDRKGAIYLGHLTNYLMLSNGKSKTKSEFICTHEEFEQRAKELGYVNGYKWGVVYENKKHGEDLPDGLEISITVSNWNDTGSIWLSKRTPKSLVGNISGSFKITDERYKPKEQDMNDWYKNGELPPVGVKLMGARAGNKDGVTEWFDFPRYDVVAHHVNGKVFFVEVLNSKGDCISTEKFDVGCNQYKPIPTETDKLVEQMRKDLAGHCGVSYEIATAIFKGLAEQGYRKIKPMSEDEFIAAANKYAYKGLYQAGCRFIEQGE